MPYYHWTGINLEGKDCSGIMLARGDEELACQLIAQDVGLMNYKKMMPGKWWEPLSSNQRAQLFRQWATLLEAGIYIDQACSIIMHQINHSGLKIVMEDIYLNLNSGMLLSNALEHYPAYFSVVTTHVIASGEESGNLTKALLHLADYYDMVHAFSKKIRSALIAPVITSLVFFIVATLVIMIIIPGFSSLFASVHQELPYFTQLIMKLSYFFRAWFLCIIVVIMSLIGFLWYGTRRTACKKWIDFILMQMPFFGSLIKNIQCLHICASLSLLMQGGVQLVPALQLVIQSIKNEYFISLMTVLYNQVNEGKPLPALIGCYPSLFPPDVQALISVGYEANCLPLMLFKAGSIYQQKVEKTLSLLSTVIQPLLMIILGLFITGLIFALYLPIFNLSFVIY